MLATPLSKAIKTTSVYLKRLKELGIETVEDFLKYFPAKYTDQRELCQIKDIQVGELSTLRVNVLSLNAKQGFRRHMSITTALLGDETGSIEAVWFHQTYIARVLQKNMRIIVAGKAKWNEKKGRMVLQNPIFEMEKSEQVHTARLVPVYHETELSDKKKTSGRLSSKWIRDKLFPLMSHADHFQEFLPETMRTTYKLIPYSEAVRSVHFPKNEKTLELAQHRLAFDEIFLLQLAALYRRAQYRKITRQQEKAIPADWELMKTFTRSLPWPLTNAQKKAIYEILTDMAQPYPMTRLLEGDVGSGKTVVCAAAMLSAVKAGWQTCLLAPTEILARQHFQTLSKILKSFEIQPVLLVGSMTEKEKQEVSEGLKQGKIAVVIGTHAILQERVGFSKLALAVIDEQHRFGVRQREALRAFGSPHILHLTATPIPRTLALVIYGDQDLSILDEMPPGRKPVETHVVSEKKRAEAYKWIAAEIKKGRQAFIIFPLIEESDVLEVKAATQGFERLQNDIFPNLKLGLLHGRMPTEEKRQAMDAFVKAKTHILVSTAVVEVGVDVPNATIMMIEGAERFGLAQLHQFRGRVGRGSDQSYCFLFPSSPKANFLSNGGMIQRLQSLAKYHSGFKLAEIDLKLRGPGQVYGTSQSGIPDLKMALFTDASTIQQAREAAISILNDDSELLKYPGLKEKILEQQNVTADAS